VGQQSTEAEDLRVVVARPAAGESVAAQTAAAVVELVELLLLLLMD